MGFSAGAAWSELAKKSEDDNFHAKSLVLKTLFLLLLVLIARYPTTINVPFYEDLFYMDLIYNLLILVGSIFSIVLLVFLIRQVTRFSWLFAALMSIAEGVFLGMVIHLFTKGILKHALNLSLMTTIAVLFGLLVLYLDDTLRKGRATQKVIVGLFAGLLPVGLFTIYYIDKYSLFDGGTFYLYLGVILFSYLVSTIYLIQDFDQVTTDLNHKISYKYEFLLAISLLLGIIFVYVKLLLDLLMFFVKLMRGIVNSKYRQEEE